MPFFKANLSTFEIDEKSFVTNLTKDIEDQIKGAAKGFLQIASASTPVRTGFAKGAFRNLEEALGIGVQSFSVLNFFRKKKVSKSLPGAPKEYYHGILKTPTSSKPFGTNPNEVFVRKGLVFTFNYEINIDYFNINDPNSNPRVPSAPWKAFERGRAFFLEYLRRNTLKTITNINDFLIETQLTVANNSVSNVTVQHSDIIKVIN